MKNKSGRSCSRMENGVAKELLTISGLPAILTQRKNSPKSSKQQKVVLFSPRSTPTPTTDKNTNLLTISGLPAPLTPRKHSSKSRKENRGKLLTPSPTAGPVIDQKHRKLILHFDVRNTILVADSVTQIGVEQALNSYLSGVTWGYENEAGEWEWVSKEPSLNAPEPGCMTYYKYLEKRLVRTPTDRGTLRQHTGDFTQEELGAMFLPYFVKSLNDFEWTHPEQDKTLTMRGENGKLYHYILPAVFQLIQHLHDTNRDFAVIIRTYGMDAPNVLKAISHSLQGNHVAFPNLPLLNFKVNSKPGSIRRHQDGTITATLDQDDQNYFFTEESEMYEFLSNQTGVCAFVDDFLYWQNNNYSSSCAKPLWINPEHTSVQHIFFDDNIRLTDSDSIVDLRMAGRDSGAANTHFSSVSLKNTEKFENMCLVHADLLQSTADINYFIDKVKLCETNYSYFLKQQNS